MIREIFLALLDRLIDCAAVTQEVPTGETVTIFINAPDGACVQSVLQEAPTGTLHVIERVE